MSDDRGRMNSVRVEVEEIEGRAQVVLIVEDVDSGLRTESIFPTTANVHRLADSLNAAAAEIEDGDEEER
jgi:hypothetical protein